MTLSLTFGKQQCAIFTRNLFRVPRRCRRQQFSEQRSIPIQVAKTEGVASVGADKTAETLSPSEIDKFRPLANEWWKIDGDCALLHSLNKLRVPFIRDGLFEAGICDRSQLLTPRPLTGVGILDIGCGGGLLSEPLARLGANVTGVDAGSELVEVARLHAAQDSQLPESLNYQCDTLECHVQQINKPYDAVVASEVLEHVASVPAFLGACDAALRPGGCLFLTTINRTVASFLGAICAAEYLLRIAPRGTHQWEKFVAPEEVQRIMAQHGYRTHVLHGMGYFPLSHNWFWTRNTAVNYAIHLIKPLVSARQ